MITNKPVFDILYKARRNKVVIIEENEERVYVCRADRYFNGDYLIIASIPKKDIIKLVRR